MSLPVTALDDSALDALFRTAATARTFTDVPVTDDELHSIVEMMRWAPTAFNAQPLRIHFVRSAEAKARLVPLTSGSNQPVVSGAPVTAILTTDLAYHDHLLEQNPNIGGMLDLLKSNDEMRISIGGFNAALQIGYFILAVRAAGLAAGPMLGIDKPGIDAEFFAGTTQRTELIVNIGHPAADAYRPRGTRLPVETIVSFL